MTDHLFTAKEISETAEKRIEHQFNENAVRLTKNLSQRTGLQRLGVHLVRLAPGHDSTTHHYHAADEEFLYIISGHGTAKIGTEHYELGPGDFMGFPSSSPAHSMHNSSNEDLLYLMGGEKQPVDVVYYPDQQKTMIKTNGERSWTDNPNLSDLPKRD